MYVREIATAVMVAFALVIATAAGAQNSSFGDGMHLVGEDISAGIYRSPGGDRCYWERLSGLGGTSADRITNDYGTHTPAVEIKDSDAAFTTRGCGTWKLLALLEQPTDDATVVTNPVPLPAESIPWQDAYASAMIVFIRATANALGAIYGGDVAPLIGSLLVDISDRAYDSGGYRALDEDGRKAFKELEVSFANTIYHYHDQPDG